MEPVTEETCKDFVYFRRLLLDARKLDDNINHRLNNMRLHEAECAQLRKEMDSLFHSRFQNITKCIEYYSHLSNDRFLHKKEVPININTRLIS